MTISSTEECTEIISSSKKRRRWTAFEKQSIDKETDQSGATPLDNSLPI